MNSGISLTGMIFIVFLVLKLTKVIDWSWWWITAPLWATFAFVFFVAVFAIGINVLAEIKKERR